MLRSKCETTADVMPERGPKPAVLVVESSRVTREIVRDTLVDSGFCVTAVDTAKAAREFIHTHAGLVILGSWLADGRAEEILRGWRQQDRSFRVPALVLFADASLADAIEVLEAGAADCLFMPIDRTELRLRVFRLLQAASPDSGGKFRDRVTTEFREPLMQTMGLADQLASQWVTSDAVASLQVLKTFLRATHRLLATDGDTKEFAPPATNDSLANIEPVRIEPATDFVPPSHLPVANDAKVDTSNGAGGNDPLDLEPSLTSR